jgi:hypothetical protein
MSFYDKDIKNKKLMTIYTLCLYAHPLLQLAEKPKQVKKIK